MEVINKIQSYLDGLDWEYMLTFLVISYVCTKDGMITKWWKEGKNKAVNSVRKFILGVPKGLRVAILGLLYAVIIYHIRDYDRSHIENLFQSFMFVTAFYGLFLAKLVKKIEKFGGKKVESKADEVSDKLDG